MMTSLVITLVGPDRPGLVSAVSDKAAEFGANWADSLMANLAGQFAGIVHLQVAAKDADNLMEALRVLQSPGMMISVAKGDAGAGTAPTRRLKLDLVGQDRPGIIRSISNQLAQRGISIEKLKTEITSGAMSGEQMFQMNALLLAPAALDDDELRNGLEGLANELMVDISLDDSKGG
ncbi:MAG: ACT domain-containing protein [Betaproteobacteria bacterium]